MTLCISSIHVLERRITKLVCQIIYVVLSAIESLVTIIFIAYIILLFDLAHSFICVYGSYRPANRPAFGGTVPFFLHTVSL